MCKPNQAIALTNILTFVFLVAVLLIGNNPSCHHGSSVGQSRYVIRASGFSGVVGGAGLPSRNPPTSATKGKRTAFSGQAGVRQAQTLVFPIGSALLYRKPGEPLHRNSRALTGRPNRSCSQVSGAGGSHVSAKLPRWAIVSRSEPAKGERSMQSAASWNTNSARGGSPPPWSRRAYRLAKQRRQFLSRARTRLGVITLRWNSRMQQRRSLRYHSGSRIRWPTRVQRLA